MRRFCRFALVFAVLFAFTTAEMVQAQVESWTNVSNVDLGSDGFDFDYDLSRNLAYVSVPDRNEISYVSLFTGEIMAQHFVGSRPQGIDYGRHSDQVYVALNQAGALAQVNPDNQSVNEIVVGGSNGTGNALVNDVVEAADGVVFASANPGSGGFAWIARVETDNNNLVSRVASNRIIRAAPTFLTTPDEDILYVAEGFSPNSLYALDITDISDLAPIVLEDDHGSVSGTQFSDISPDGERIYLSSGQVLRSESLLQVGRIGSGRSRLSSDGETAFVFQNGNLVGYNTNNFLANGVTIELPSEFSRGIDQFEFLPGDRGVVALSGQNLFIATAVPEPGCGLLAFIGLFVGVSRRRRG